MITNEKKIVFQAQGGLGNQLFQYAAARRLSLKNDCSLIMDQRWFDKPRSGETPWAFQLFHYPVDMRMATSTELLCWAPMRSRLARYIKPLLPMRLLLEHGVSVNSEVLTASSNCYMSGYWQSEQYFLDIRSKLVTELTPIEPPGQKDLYIVEKMQEGNAVSLHIRRGDYVSLPSASAYHGLCSLDYYQKAIRYIAERVVNPIFFVFSDDPLWAKENLSLPFLTHYVDHNPASMAFQDLRLMSLCRHHILANSSFSWWGAWLSQALDGLVIAPEQWFANGRPTPDLIPARWIRMGG